jgi:hypothetical protein
VPGRSRRPVAHRGLWRHCPEKLHVSNAHTEARPRSVSVQGRSSQAETATIALAGTIGRRQLGTTALEPLASSHGLRRFGHLIESLKRRRQGSVEGYAVPNSADLLGTKDPLKLQVTEQAAPALPAAPLCAFVFPSDKKSAAAIRK